MKRDKTMRVVIFAVVLLIPVIYSFFYLKSYWDPYDNLTDMKIAIVNLDKGENEKNQGKEFVKELKDSNTFDICETNKDEAEQGMEKGKYYATITIPEDFTTCLNSASKEEKQIANLTYSPNQASNYLGTQIINSAIKTIESKLQTKIDGEIVAELSDKLKEVPQSLEDISDGAKQILDGSESLNTGLAQINDGTSELNNSYTEFNQGVHSAYEGGTALETGLKQASNGTKALSDGSNNLNNAITQINGGLNELKEKGNGGVIAISNGITGVNEGANKLNQGVTTYANGANSLAQGTKQYIAGSQTLNSNVNNYINNATSFNNTINQFLTAVSAQSATNPELATKAQQILDSQVITNLNSAGVQIQTGINGLNNSSTILSAGADRIIGNTESIKQGANDLYKGTTTLAQGTSGLTAITGGIDKLQAGLNQVQDGTGSLKQGVNTLDTGITALEQGSEQLTSGLGTLDSSSNKVQTAIQTLSQGTNSAYEGSTELLNGIETFNNEIDNGLNSTNEALTALNGIEDMAKNPVELKTEAYGEVESYGIAFTPLFLCIGLWVGALMGYVVFYYDQKNRFSIFGSHYKHKVWQNMLYLGIGAIEGLLTAALLKMGLGFEVENLKLYYVASILTGIAFTSIIQFLIRNFGDIGKFISLIILVLQLAASGGTFPIETINKAFQAFSPYLPMTYAIKLFKEILIPTASNFKAEYMTVLLIISIVLVTITCLVDVLKREKKHIRHFIKDRNPETT